jgi:Ohr subfamily peroxiredoxin
MASDGGRTGSVEAADGNFRVSFGEQNGGRITPEHLFAGAYAACFHSALAGAAERAHQKIPGLSVIANVALEENGHGECNLTIELRSAMPGVERSDAEHLLHLAHQTCPYSRALRGKATVTLTLD